MRKSAYIFSSTTVILAAFATTSARGQSTPAGLDLVDVTAEPSVATIHPKERFLLAFRFRIAPFWHIYWRNPGDTGTATAITVKAPDGFKVGEIIWSRPVNIPGEFVSYGYEQETVLFIPVLSPETMETGEVNFEADLDWLVCKETCLLGKDSKTITVKTTSEPLPAEEKKDRKNRKQQKQNKDNKVKRELRSKRQFDNKQIAEWYQKRIPVRLSKLKKSASMEFDGKTAVITGPAKGFEKADFFPSHSAGVSATISELTITDDVFKLVLDITADETNSLGEKMKIRGVLALGPSGSDPSFWFEIPVKDE